MPEYSIHLNFLPVRGPFPGFRVYRRERQQTDEARPPGLIQCYSLPRQAEDLETRSSYWVSLENLEGYDEFTTLATFNHDLTRWVLFRGLEASAKGLLPNDQFWVPERSFLQEVHFPMASYPEGAEMLIVQPYYLGAQRAFGFLVDFHFRLGEHAKFSRRVQQLSLYFTRVAMSHFQKSGN